MYFAYDILDNGKASFICLVNLFVFCNLAASWARVQLLLFVWQMCLFVRLFISCLLKTDLTLVLVMKELVLLDCLSNVWIREKLLLL